MVVFIAVVVVVVVVYRGREEVVVCECWRGREERNEGKESRVLFATIINFRPIQTKAEQITPKPHNDVTVDLPWCFL